MSEQTITTTPTEAEAADQALLQGERQTGQVPLPNGTVAEHAISGDGMKYTRIQGNPNGSANDFYDKKRAEADAFEDQHGVRPAGAPPRAEAVPVEQKHTRISALLSKLFRK